MLFRRNRVVTWACLLGFVTALMPAHAAPAAEPLRLGQTRELFVDSHLIESLERVSLTLHEPRDEGPVLQFDQPWEGPFSAYCTVLHREGRTRVYYRGKPQAQKDGLGEVTCVAESSDGRNFTRPNLGLFEIDGTRSNNVVWGENDLSHNFSPFYDENPATPQSERFKAVGGTARSGLVGFVSADGFQWKKLRDEPVLTKAALPTPNVFDSQNVVFWSVTEKRYVMFFRMFHAGKRRIARAESQDFVQWTNIMMMEYRGPSGDPMAVEELYTNQTHPYFRAPHLYVALAARFMPGRQVLTPAQAKAINVHPSYFKDTSDAVFLTTRGGPFYDRTFPEAILRPGIGAENWVSRTTYPALNVVQTGPTEMSLYANQNYAQPTAHLRRYSLRLDGFTSVRAPQAGGEFRTRPLVFEGTRLLLNFATSAAGGLRVELQDALGQPIPGFSLNDCVEVIGNEIERAVRWTQGEDLRGLAGRTIRLRFAMKDADLYALRFAD